MSVLSHKHRVRTYHGEIEPASTKRQGFDWGTSVAFEPALIRTYAPPVAFLRMQIFARRASEAPRRHEAVAVTARRAGFRALFLRGESAAIGQLLMLDLQRQVRFVKHVLTFVETSGSVDGLDGLLLTSVVSMELAGRSDLAFAAMAKLRRAATPVRPGNVPVWNMLTQRVTFFATAAQAVAALTGGGHRVTIPMGGGATDDPQENHDTCVNTWKAVGAIAGTVLGAFAGTALTGAALSGAGVHGGENTGGSAAGGAAGGLAGAQGGDILAGDIAQLACPSAKPAGAAAGAGPAGAAAPGTADPESGVAPADSDEPDVAEQDGYAAGFAAGWAAANGQAAPGSSDANSAAKGWGSGFADGFGAGAFVAPAPATTGVPADNASGQPAPDASGSQPAPDPQGSGDPAPSGEGPDPAPPPDTSAASDFADDDGQESTGAPGAPPGSRGFPNPGLDGGNVFSSPTLAFGTGIDRYVNYDGDGDGDGVGSYTVIGMARINAGNGLVDPGVLASPAGRAALDDDDDDIAGSSGSFAPARTRATNGGGAFHDTDPDHNPKAAGAAARSAMRLMGAGFAQELLAAVGADLPG